MKEYRMKKRCETIMHWRGGCSRGVDTDEAGWGGEDS